MPLVLAVCRGRCNQLVEQRTLRNGLCSACRRPAARRSPQLTLDEALEPGRGASNG